MTRLQANVEITPHPWGLPPNWVTKLDEKVKDDEEKGMENASEIRDKVVQFFQVHEDSGQTNNTQSSQQNKPFLPQLSAESIDTLDQATKFLDSQLLNLGWRLYFSQNLLYLEFRKQQENRGGGWWRGGDRNTHKIWEGGESRWDWDL